MKKAKQILLLVLASIGMLFAINVNAEDWSDDWFTQSDTEQVKELKKEEINKLVALIPDDITVDVKEIDAPNKTNNDDTLNDVSKIITEKVNKSLKDGNITFPITLETTDDNGEKVKITISEPIAGVVPYNIDYDAGGIVLEKNLNKAYVEASITTNYSGGGSSIATTIKTINITYSDSNKRNDADQKYVDEKVKEQQYLFYNLNEFHPFGYEEDYEKLWKELLAKIKDTIKDDSLEFKPWESSPWGRGDFDFGFEEWLVVVYKNGIAYKIIDVGVATTVKITIPNTVEDNEDAYFKYVSDLFSNTDIGKPISMKLLNDINDHFDESFKFPDNEGYYEFTFNVEDGETIQYAFKLVKEAKTNPITSVKLDKTALTLEKGKTIKLNATINPSDTTDNKTLTWSSSNPKVATVDQNGNVKAISAGTTTITVKTSNGKTAAVKVTVTGPITSVKINQKNLTVVTGKTSKLTATISPSNTTQSKTLTWTSSNTKVATVDKNGVVKGIKKGTANITVKTSNGKTATVKVTVTNPVKIKSVKLNKKTLKLELGKSATVKATINPSNTTDSKTLTWSTSNKKVATVDNNGKITAVGGGKATITVKTSNGKKATVKVTVSKINAKKATTTAIKNQVQTGKAIKPAVEVKLNGKILKNGTDYTVSYKNNKNAGKATVTVKFKGNYTGSKTATFLIIPSKVNIKNPTTAKKSITVKYSKVSGATGYQIGYRIQGAQPERYVTSTSSSKKITKLSSNFAYEVRVRAYKTINGKKVYGAWSDVKTIVVK